MHSTPQGRNVRLNSEAASNVRKVVHDRLSWRDESVACDGHAGIAHSCNADPLVDAPRCVEETTAASGYPAEAD